MTQMSHTCANEKVLIDTDLLKPNNSPTKIQSEIIPVRIQGKEGILVHPTQNINDRTVLLAKTIQITRTKMQSLSDKEHNKQVTCICPTAYWRYTLDPPSNIAMKDAIHDDKYFIIKLKSH